MLEVVRAPDRQRRRHAAAGEVEDRELAVVERPADDLLVPLARPGRRTRASPSRRGPTRSRGPRRSPRARRRSRARPPRPGRARPPSARSAAGGRGRRSRTRSSRRPPRRRGAEVSSARGAGDAAALPQLQPGRAGEHDVGHRARAHHDDVGVERPRPRSSRPAARGPRPRSAPARRRPATSIPCASSTPPKKRPACSPKPRHIGASSCMTIVHVLPSVGEAGRDLAGDVGAADEHDVRGVRDLAADGVRVAERAQVVDALELGARHPQAAHVGARGEHGVAEADLLLVGERRGPAPSVSSFITLVRVSSSTPRSSHQSAGRR